MNNYKERKLLYGLNKDELINFISEVFGGRILSYNKYKIEFRFNLYDNIDSLTINFDGYNIVFSLNISTWEGGWGYKQDAIGIEYTDGHYRVTKVGLDRQFVFYDCGKDDIYQEIINFFEKNTEGRFSEISRNLKLEKLLIDE